MVCFVNFRMCLVFMLTCKPAQILCLGIASCLGEVCASFSPLTADGRWPHSLFVPSSGINGALPSLLFTILWHASYPRKKLTFPRYIYVCLIVKVSTNKGYVKMTGL